METLAHNIAHKIAIQMDYDQNKKSVIAYGLTAIFQMVTIFIIITLFGLILNFWYESIIIFFGVGIIRKSTGGAHSRTMYGCIAISVLSITSLSALSRYLLNFLTDDSLNIYITIFVFIIAFIIFYLRVPVDSPNKPIIKKEKVSKLRKQSFTILIIFIILSLLTINLTNWNSRFYSITRSLWTTILWQTFTLTKVGHKFFGIIDSLLS